jgi:(1->4)-alpha-D-glucan 1-alpha-D-glucosylmutase
LARFSDNGRAWPRTDGFDATVHLGGYAVDEMNGMTDVPISMLFKHLPVAVVKARAEAAASQPRSAVPA